jgi:hypothetical protein
MPVAFIFTAREHHNVRSVQDYRARHAAEIARKARRGARFTVHEVTTPVVARIDGNTWCIDCPDCRAGNATDPAWQIACCFACGAVSTVITFPDAEMVADIEAALLTRDRPWNRHWLPHQTLFDVVFDNMEFGAPIPPAVAARIAESEP